MKTVLFALISAVSIAAFAGPEEHNAAQVCYHLQPGSQVLVPQTPEQICLEEVSVDLEKAQINVYSYFTPYLYKDLQVTYLARHNENGFSFRSEAVLQKQTAVGCDSGSESVLKIQGRTGNDGEVEPQNLEITIEQSATSDNCHSRGAKSVLTYKVQ
jgi:hypothetical protein